MVTKKSDPLRRLQDLFFQWEPLLGDARWYLTVVSELDAFKETIHDENSEVQNECKESIYDFFEMHLTKGNIALGSNRKSADTERKTIDTMVIHHTSNRTGLTPERLSAIELVRLSMHPTMRIQRDQRISSCAKSQLVRATRAMGNRCFGLTIGSFAGTAGQNGFCTIPRSAGTPAIGM